MSVLGCESWALHVSAPRRGSATSTSTPGLPRRARRLIPASSSPSPTILCYTHVVACWLGIACAWVSGNARFEVFQFVIYYLSLWLWLSLLGNGYQVMAYIILTIEKGGFGDLRHRWLCATTKYQCGLELMFSQCAAVSLILSFFFSCHNRCIVLHLGKIWWNNYLACKYCSVPPLSCK